MSDNLTVDDFEMASWLLNATEQDYLHDEDPYLDNQIFLPQTPYVECVLQDLY